MRRRAVVVATVVVAVGLVVGVAWGHTSVRTAVPEPGAAVTGTVDEIVLEFFGPVLTVAVEVTGPAGPVPAPASIELRDASTAVQPIEPLDVVGDYVVDITYTAADGSRQQDAYEFTYDGPGGSSRTSLVGALAALLVGLGGLVLWARRRPPAVV